MRAVIVDADPLRRAALDEELARHDYDIVHAESAAEALTASVHPEVGLVVVADRVAEEDGLELCRALRGTPGAEDRVIVIVGTTQEVQVLAALEAGAADVWPVPDPEASSHVGLRVKLAEHYARLQAEHVRLGGEFALLRDALDRAGTGFVMSDPLLDDNPIVYANESFYAMTGYTAAEVLGHNCRFLQGPATNPSTVRRIADGLRAERPVTVELVNYRADGTPFWNEVHMSPVRDARGRVVRHVGVQVDVTAYRERERLFVHEQSARAEAEASERRLAFLSEASPLLDASLDLRSTLESLTRLSVPFLGDVCLVEEVSRGEVRRLAIAAADPGVERLVRSLPAGYPVGPAEERDDPVLRCVRGGRAEILADGGPGVLGPAAASGADALPPDLVRAAMIVPMMARGRTIGALAFLRVSGERPYTPEDLALATELGRRAALALDNARLYERQSEVASALQAGLLPPSLPEVEGVELAARFRPAGDGTVIGGDFYDVVVADEDESRFDVVVGDVTGKGPAAASVTGMARHTLRTAARYEGRPSAVLEVLNRALLEARVGEGRYCTVAFCRFAVLGEGRVKVTVSIAGHPQPIVLRQSGAVEPVGRPGSILGWMPDPTLHEEEVVLETGEAVIVYTDGVSETRTSEGMLGDDDLTSVLASGVGLDAGAIAARLERAALASGNPRDDVALVVIRAVAPTGAQAASDPQEAAQGQP